MSFYFALQLRDRGLYLGYVRVHQLGSLAYIIHAQKQVLNLSNLFLNILVILVLHRQHRIEAWHEGRGAAACEVQNAHCRVVGACTEPI